MKAVTIFGVILTCTLLVCPSSTAEYSMSSLMSLLTGSVARQPKPRGLEVKQEEKETSLLETLNLSYAGNMDFSRALDQAKNIGSSLATAVGSIVDLKLVHNFVSVALDKLGEADRRGRSEEKMREQEELKSGITTVVGAALGEQQCWEKTACKAGEYAASLPGKDVIFIVLDRLVPSSWLDTLDSVKESATYEQNCNRYECSTDPEGTENDA